MKRNRKSISYKVWYWFHIRGWKDVAITLFEIFTGVVFFALIFILPHIFH